MLSQRSRRSSPALTRRRVLVDGGRAGCWSLALLGVDRARRAGRTVTRRSGSTRRSSWTLARRDSELATAAAKPRRRRWRAALTEVAAERSRHATALIEEIARAARQPTPTSSDSAAPTTTSAAAGPPPSVDDVVATLRSSADSATKLAPSLSGYRAGLLGVHRGIVHDAVLAALPSKGRPQ